MNNINNLEILPDEITAHIYRSASERRQPDQHPEQLIKLMIDKEIHNPKIMRNLNHDCAAIWAYKHGMRPSTPFSPLSLSPLKNPPLLPHGKELKRIFRYSNYFSLQDTANTPACIFVQMPQEIFHRHYFREIEHSLQICITYVESWKNPYSNIGAILHKPGVEI